MKYITIIAKISGFFSFKIVCSFIDLLILINVSEYNAVVWWYFRFLKHSDRYHFFSIGIWSNLQIFFINLYHLYVRKTICERYFIINWAFLKIIFSNAKKKLYFKNSRSDSTTCMNQKIKCEHVWHMITLVFWFWEDFFFKCYFFFLSYTFFRAPESLGWLGQHFNKFDCPLPRMLCDKFNWNW